ncbi:MAG: integrase core domain-containing protein [Sedimentisphaerales bacterium]
MKQKLWLTIITCLASYCIDKELYKAIEYLKEQVRVLKELQEKDKRILLNDDQRMRLARKAKELTRKLLEETSLLFSPDTILGWYRKLIAKKYDGSAYTHKKVGRPNTYINTVRWVLKIKPENTSWGTQKICDCLNNLGFDIPRTTVRNILVANGYDPEPNRKTTWKQFLKTHWNVLAACDFFSIEFFTSKGLVRCMVLFAINLATRKVEIIGIKSDPDGIGMEQVARNMVDCEEGFLKEKKYLIHDRDPLFTPAFCSVLESEDIECIKLPPHSPNLNAFAERFIRTAREECLNHLILHSEQQLRYVLSEFLDYYHTGRVHQGIGKIIEPIHEDNTGDIFCVERLGGLLKSYHRKAA